uniref:Uncharacterized protein n=1 Tax=Hyaloperonospora arabidopsidis (strain Emoy2) TaxID=559515 RepID=M4C1D2_HYAAE
MCGDHAVRLKIVGTPYRLFPIVHLPKLKRLRIFPEHPKDELVVEKGIASTSTNLITRR